MPSSGGGTKLIRTLRVTGDGDSKGDADGEGNRDRDGDGDGDSSGVGDTVAVEVSWDTTGASAAKTPNIAKIVIPLMPARVF